MATDQLPLAIRTLFADLLQRLEIALPAGSVYTRQIDGTVYLYAKVPVGNDRVDTFLGRADDPAVEARAKGIRDGMASAKARRALVSMLRRVGLAAPDRILGTTLDSFAHAGLFRDGAVLVGTAAYMQFEPLVGQRLPTPTLMTGDLDLATARLALTAEPPQSMEQILHRADPSFTGLMNLDPRMPSWRFRNADDYQVELLTPMRTRMDSHPMPLPALNAGAAPLQHLSWLIAEPVPTAALWGGGVLINVPQPAKFAVHKLIIAQRRNPMDRIKRTKDLMQAKALMAALRREDPFALEDALDDARAQGKDGWAERIDRSLKELGL